MGTKYSDSDSDAGPRHVGNTLTKLVYLGIILVLGLIGLKWLFGFTTIHGNELGVEETWNNGVLDKVFQPGFYVLGPGKTIYPYDASSQVFVMNDKAQDKDAYLVQSLEGQDMRISLNLRWRINPALLVSIHKTVRKDIEQKIIRPVVMRVVKDEATKMKAIDAYSGEGLVQLQKTIQASLSKGDGEGREMAERGVTVENFVIEHIELDPKYIDEIKQKQIATQKQLRAVEEQKAAEAEALVAKALAQADFNKRVVEAERDAKVMVTKAQAENEQAIIAAQAEQQKQSLEAEGKKTAMIAIADGTLAQGKAEAAAKELMLRAYAVQGADSWVKVEVSKSLAAAFGNIKGYLPSDMKINLLTGNWLQSVDAMTGNPVNLPGKPSASLGAQEAAQVAATH